ncbi:flagellar basal-body rod protein FlgF [Desulfocurvus sp.]|jgi:flagellar basal-body rod protein FlgG|uniref:flagellar basal-body rod protein FlgF n=1 Tax=Desulfocurvus sp. TaxID=2871698 RepID=UPI0025BC2680|nr:flagellar basal-body rod protein FlgF [Desulfocurvus sp.]MCK9239172.1 flagellar basal-body rod protein FlgF [Desulfocurvus sp.]
MQESMYSAMFGALTQEHRLNVVANNLANVNTTGYKRDRMAFKDVFIRFAHDDIREPVFNLKSRPLFPDPDHYAKPRIAVSQIDFDQGSLKQTGNDLDVALSGEGFFKVRTPEGEDLYTRAGAFHVNAAGQLVNGNGDAVLGVGGPIELPEGARPTINGAGEIIVDGAVVDALTVVGVDNPLVMEKVGHTYFRIRTPGAAAETAVPDTMVEQGYLEMPNVEVVTEMVNMIETHRAFEAYQKIITNTRDTDSKAIEQVGRDK